MRSRQSPPPRAGRRRAPRPAAVALAVALEDLDGRRLAGAVRAEQPEDLAGGDLEADAADGLDLAVRLAQAADLDRGSFTAARSTTMPAGGNRRPRAACSSAAIGRNRAGGRPRRPSSPRPSTASRTLLGGCAGREPLVDLGPLRRAPARSPRRLAGAQERAREDHRGGRSALRGEPRAELPRLPLARCGQRAQLVRLAGRSLCMADEQQPHG